MDTSHKTDFSEEQMRRVLSKPVPRHVAIIMDGNRRWTKQNTLRQLKNVIDGHWAGADTLVNIVRAAKKIGIKVLTVYGLSTENRFRTPKEVETIFYIVESYLKANRRKMKEEGVKFNAIGDSSLLPPSLKKVIEEVKEETREGHIIELVLALNYGSRDEIKRAMQKIAKKCLNGQLEIDAISEQCIADNLDTCEIGDPDLLIRTSSEMRLSNFLLWQVAYTEIVVTDVLWPDFSQQNLLEAVFEFQNRERRIGK